MWGWMPISRSLATDCWVGLVFNSPAAARNGTSVTWMKITSFGFILEGKLPHGLQEGEALDVPGCAANLR